MGADQLLFDARSDGFSCMLQVFGNFLIRKFWMRVMAIQFFNQSMLADLFKQLVNKRYVREIQALITKKTKLHIATASVITSVLMTSYLALYCDFLFTISIEKSM